MQLGYFTLTNGAPGESDRILQALADRLTAEGLQVAGAVQINIDKGADCACDMEMRVIGDDAPPVRISQSLGGGSSGCRLDTGALEEVAGRVAARLTGDADLLVLTKFGKQEAIGRGFCQVIAQALQSNVPVILHVSPEQRLAFDAFAGDMSQPLSPDTLDAWCRKTAAARRAA